MKTVNILFSLVFFFLAASSHAQSPETSGLGSCSCQFAGKDYDPSKGYYFDQVHYWPYPHVSARFACVYDCQNLQGEHETVTHVYENSYFGTSKGGVENAKKNICPDAISNFIPHYDTFGTLIYYETEPIEYIEAKQSSVDEIRNWAERSCNK